MSRTPFLWTAYLLAVLMALPAIADHDGVTLYRDDDYRGRSESFNGDVPSLARTQIGNDSASSIDVARGCEVTLYTDVEYRGRSQTFTRGVASLGRTRVGNDSVSSLRVDCGGGYGPGGGYDGDPNGGGPGGGYDDGPGGGGPGSGRSGVTVYSGSDYRGDSETFYRDDPRLYNNEIGQDRARSVRVSPGCEVILYEHPDYGGRAVHLTGDRRDLSQTRLGNAGVSSVRVTCRSGGYNPPGGYPGQGGNSDGQRRGVTLYHDDDFRGGSERFYEDRSNLGRSRIGNDNASSIRVDPGCRAVLYRDSNFRGASAVITRDVSSLRRTVVGNDGASSLRVKCRRWRNWR